MTDTKDYKFISCTSSQQKESKMNDAGRNNEVDQIKFYSDILVVKTSN